VRFPCQLGPLYVNGEMGCEMRPTVPSLERHNRTPDTIRSTLAAGRLTLEPLGQARGVALLLVSTAFAEVASNIVYVVLVERAYQLGNGATAIGVVLILQAVAQVICGSWYVGPSHHPATSGFSSCPRHFAGLCRCSPADVGAIAAHSSPFWVGRPAD